MQWSVNTQDLLTWAQDGPFAAIATLVEDLVDWSGEACVAEDLATSALSKLEAVLKCLQDNIPEMNLFSLANAAGIPAVISSMGFAYYLYPAMWPVALAHAYFSTKAMMLIFGIQGVCGFLISQAILIRYDRPPWHSRDEILLSSAWIYLAASWMPPLTHFALHFEFVKPLLSMDLLLLASACCVYSYHIRDEMLNLTEKAWTSSRSAGASQSAEPGSEPELQIQHSLGFLERTVRMGPRSAGLASAAGARSCALFSVTGVLWFLSILPEAIA